MSNRLPMIAAFVACAFTLTLQSDAQSPKKLTVSAGGTDRRDAIVPVTLPDGTGPGVWTLRDDSGREIPLQVGPGGRGRFILGELKAGQTRTYTVQEGGDDADSGVRAERDGGALRLSFGGKYILDYQGQPTDLPEGYDPKFQRGGY